MTGVVVPDRRMLEALVCPVTHAVLTWDADRQELISKAAHLAFPVRDGIPVMLIEEAETVSDGEHDRLMAKVAAEGLRPTFEAKG